MYKIALFVIRDYTVSFIGSVELHQTLMILYSDAQVCFILIFYACSVFRPTISHKKKSMDKISSHRTGEWLLGISQNST